jgi:iron complex transport system substrate-binding protein
MRNAEDVNRIATKILDAAFAVHRYIGPGCFETAYEPCFAYELRKQGLHFERQVSLSIQYEELLVPDAYFADFIVEGCVVVELKAIEQIARVHLRQLHTYLRLTGCPLGLLINFGADTMRDGIKRIVNNFPTGTPPRALLRAHPLDETERNGNA